VTLLIDDFNQARFDAPPLAARPQQSLRSAPNPRVLSASSFYPFWLPTSPSAFRPGDVITFGASIPSLGSGAPGVDVADTLVDCTPIATAAPTLAPSRINGSATVGSPRSLKFQN
jgi:hypothetical protein